MTDAARPLGWRARLATSAILAGIALAWLLLDRRPFLAITLAALLLTLLGFLPWPPAQRLSHGFGQAVAILARILARAVITVLYLSLVWPPATLIRGRIRQRLSPDGEGHGWVAASPRIDYERMF